jgi:hypothetical protein
VHGGRATHYQQDKDVTGCCDPHRAPECGTVGSLVRRIVPRSMREYKIKLRRRRAARSDARRCAA